MTAAETLAHLTAQGAQVAKEGGQLKVTAPASIAGDYELGPAGLIVMTLSGRGDKDIDSFREATGGLST